MNIILKCSILHNEYFYFGYFIFWISKFNGCTKKYSSQSHNPTICIRNDTAYWKKLYSGVLLSSLRTELEKIGQDCMLS